MKGAPGSWGKIPPSVPREVRPLRWITDPLPVPAPGNKLLPYGLGRTYGDVCLNNGGMLAPTRELNHFIAFDDRNGIIRCEAGVSFDELLRLIVPRGWFLPTTPGTKYVTVGGAIANDIHGKDHHRSGTFGCHVTQLELLRSDGERLICSPTKNADWFRATVAGLGLTGLITWAEFKLRRIQTAYIEMESIKCRDLEDVLQVSAESSEKFRYTVSWQDCLAKGASLGRGIFMRGNHAENAPGGLRTHGQGRVGVPLDFPAFALNPVSTRIFNTAYYGRLRSRVTAAQVHYDPFFYPLDAIGNWNRIYGRRGFFQYQFVVPFTSDHGAVREIFKRIAASGHGSFLAVFKTFGYVPSPGMLSFPMAGPTLALDFPNTGENVRKLFDTLDEIVLSAGGRIYPAKDARMSPRAFQKSFPNWSEFAKWIDPAFSSSFWRRVTEES